MAPGPPGEVGGEEEEEDGEAHGRQGGAQGPAIGPVGARGQVLEPPQASGHVAITCYFVLSPDSLMTTLTWRILSRRFRRYKPALERKDLQRLYHLQLLLPSA